MTSALFRLIASQNAPRRAQRHAAAAASLVQLAKEIATTPGHTDTEPPPIIRLMARDSGARLSLMRMLPLWDLARLVASSRSWRAWTTEQPAAVGSQLLFIRSDASMDSLKRCGWLHRSLQSLRFSGQEVTGWIVHQLLCCLPRLVKLRSVDVEILGGMIEPRMFYEAFASVAPRLTHLHLSMVRRTEREASEVWGSLCALKELVSLSASLPADTVECWIDFSFLPSMRRLTKLSVQRSGRGWECTPGQVDALKQCAALTDLRCGHWTVAMLHPQPRVEQSSVALAAQAQAAEIAGWQDYGEVQ